MPKPPRKPTGAATGASQKDAGREEEDDAPMVWSDGEKREIATGNMVGGAYGAFVLALYLRTMHPTVAGGDSGELMGAACELGTAHPPGYPLFTMLSWLGTQVIPTGSPGYRLNVVTVLFAAAGARLHYQAALLWHVQHMRGYALKDDAFRGSAWAALMASSLFSLGALAWMYSTHAEVFALNNMFVSLLLYLSVRYAQERRTALARLGALCIGLGLSNQHTLILYALPLAGWMAWLGRRELLRPAVFAQLALCGLLGLTPYLYLFWSATHAPLGSWGDTSTLSGWPAVGFWTHFLRREYGTFALYSGSSAKNQMMQAFGLYGKHAFEDTFGLVLLAPLGAAASLLRGGGSGVIAGVAITLYLAYMLIFHYLSNLPLDKPLFLGVMMRFWMQPHAILFTFIPLGATEALSRLGQWRPETAAPLAALTAGALVGANFRRMDQSANRYVEEFGRALLTSRKGGAILLTQGDMVTNSIRYLQRCEKQRLDVAHLDMPMMTYEWYKTMHGPHLPGGVELPGVQFSVGGKRVDQHRKCCAYSMKAFLDANVRRNATRPMYLVGGWYGSEVPQHVNPKGGIQGYEIEHVGMVSRIVPETKPLSWREFKEEMAAGANFTLEHIPPPSYDEMTWEHTIRTNYVTYMQATFVSFMDKAILRGKEPGEGSIWIKEQKSLRKAIQGLETALAYARETPGGFESLEDILRNLGIAYGRLKCPKPNEYPKVDCPGQTKMRVLFKEFLRVTSKRPEEVANEKLVVDNPNAFINLAGE